MKTEVKNLHSITLILCYIAMMFGVAYSGVEKLCGLLSLRHLKRQTYVHYANYIRQKTVQHATDVLERSRKAVVTYYAEKLGRHPDENGILDVDVSFDGTWHTRGHSSLLGAGAVIEQNTGLILDYECLSKVCSVCSYQKARKKKEVTEEEFTQWMENHTPDCDANYDGTSGGMERSEAVACWTRSLEHKMRYTNFVGDGDSSGYLAITSCNEGEGPYGKEHPVIKSDCINHVAKRLGNGLRNLRKETQTVQTKGGKTVKRSVIGGAKKLTDKVITRLQFYFRRGIKRKVNTSEEEMRADIMSSFYHCSSSHSNPCHDYCPKTNDSWCF